MSNQIRRFSKIIIFALALACAAAFIPMAGPAFAAKKPAKVKGVSLTQAEEMTTAGFYDVNVKWKKVRKARKYLVKVTDVTPAADPAGSDAVVPTDPAAANPMVLKVKGKKRVATFTGAVDSTYQVRVRALMEAQLNRHLGAML